MDPTNLGKYVLSMEDKRNCGRLLITANIWVLEKSWFMKNLITWLFRGIKMNIFRG